MPPFHGAALLLPSGPGGARIGATNVPNAKLCMPEHSNLRLLLRHCASSAVLIGSFLCARSANARLIEFTNVRYSYTATAAGNGFAVGNTVNGTITGSFEYDSLVNNSNSSGTWGNINVTFSANATNQNSSTTYDRAFVGSPTGLSIVGSSPAIPVYSALYFWDSSGLLPVARFAVVEYLNNTTSIYQLTQTSPVLFSTFCTNTAPAGAASGTNISCTGGTSRVNMTSLQGQMVPSPAAFLGLGPVVLLTRKRVSKVNLKSNPSLLN